MNVKQLYIFTGKGGVGKTALAMAWTLHLKRKGYKVRYHSFYQNPPRNLWNKLQLPVLDLELDQSAETYIARKLGSETIAHWVMKTNFFQSLFQVIPGLSHMILLGHIIDILEKNQDEIIVIDSPASGHALTMFESSNNFKTIFKSGLIVKDIERMHRYIYHPDKMHTYIVSLPTELSIQEALELKKSLEEHKIPESSLIINNLVEKYLLEKKLGQEQLPDFLTHRLNSEREILNKLGHLSHYDLPLINKPSMPEVIEELSNNLEGLA